MQFTGRALTPSISCARSFNANVLFLPATWIQGSPAVVRVWTWNSLKPLNCIDEAIELPLNCHSTYFYHCLPDLSILCQWTPAIASVMVRETSVSPDVAWRESVTRMEMAEGCWRPSRESETQNLESETSSRKPWRIKYNRPLLFPIQVSTFCRKSGQFPSSFRFCCLTQGFFSFWCARFSFWGTDSSFWRADWLVCDVRVFSFSHAFV